MILVLLSGLFCQALTAQPPAIPHPRKQGTATQLIVDGRPFPVLAGEPGNSSSSDVEYMRSVWPKLARMNLNAVLMPVYWERPDAPRTAYQAGRR